MIAGLSCRFRKEQRTLVALGTIPVGMVKFLCWDHLQFLRTEGNSICITFKSGMAVLIERYSGNSSMKSAGFIYVPGIKGCICGDICGKLIECIDCLLIKSPVIRYITFVERLSIFGQDNIPIISGNS